MTHGSSSRTPGRSRQSLQGRKEEVRAPAVGMAKELKVSQAKAKELWAGMIKHGQKAVNKRQK